MLNTSDGMRFGLVGCGLIGTKRALSLPTPHILQAVFDEDPVRSRTLATTCESRPKICDSLESLLQQPLDAVIVATPHNSLGPISLKALEAGHHVLCEKPGGVDYQQMLDVETRASELQRILSVGFNHRFHPSLSRCFDIISSKEFGRLLWVRGRYGHGGRLGYESEWRAHRNISGGGEMVDQGSHLIDLVRFFFGDVRLEYASLPTLFWPMEVEDNAFFALKPSTGGLAWLHSSWTEWKNLFSFEITLETAKIEISGLGGSYGNERLVLHRMSPLMGPPESSESVWSGSDESWQKEILDFVGRIRGEVSRGATMKDAAEVRSIIEQAYER